MGAGFAYDHEYLGPTARLVVTPLTERATLSLTMSLRAFHSGTLIGPPGTGKTDTIKDLAKVMNYGQNVEELGYVDARTSEHRHNTKCVVSLCTCSHYCLNVLFTRYQCGLMCVMSVKHVDIFSHFTISSIVMCSSRNDLVICL